MNKRIRKAKQKAAIIALLNAEAERIYHNATLGYVKEWADLPDWLQEPLWEAEQFFFSCDIDAINNDMYGEVPYIEARIASDYGKVYTYGRGSRTCAPKDWISEHGGSSFSIKEYDPEDLSPGRAFALYLDIEAWNAYVKAECSAESRRDRMADWIAEQLEEKAAELRRYTARILA